MSTHAFTLHLSGADEFTEKMADCLYRAGLDDALIGSEDGKIYADVDRDSPTLAEAVQSAIRDVKLSGSNLTVSDVEPPEAKAVAGI